MHIDSINIPQSPVQLLGKGGEKSEAEFQAALKDPHVWAKIPLLNYSPLHALKDQSLVRFRGMIQDMQDPEIYLERYEVKTNADSGGSTRLEAGKYRDCLDVTAGEQVNFNASANVQGERRTLFVVSLPGINTWASDYEQQCNRCNVPEAAFSGEAQSNGESSGNGKKRAASEDEEKDAQSRRDSMEIDAAATASFAGNTSKRQRVQAVETPLDAANSAKLGADYLLNSPIPDRPGRACMVKIYADFDTYSLNSIIDVVGFLSVDPTLDASTMDVDEFDTELQNSSEFQALHPPPSLIPRLHAVAVHRLPHANPLLDARLALAPESSESQDMLSVQQDLHKLLSLCLFDDDLAADYLLSHLLSTVYSRAEMQSIGKFALNIYNLPKESIETYTRQLYGILELLLPASHYLPMTLETMNTAAFVPKKDYETNKLVSGLLQLAPQTHLVLDETQMQQGKLEANGVLGIQNLAHLINQQEIKCNFHYYDIDYNADIPVLVLSEGRSMLPNDFAVPLHTDAQSAKVIDDTLKAARHFLQQPGRLTQFRCFLTHGKTREFSMNPEQSEMIQTDFVEMRQANVISNADDLHALLVLSRLLAIARGKPMLDKESWEMAKEMEAKRRLRVRNLNSESMRN